MAKDDIPGERQRAFPRERAKEQRLVQGLLSGRCGTRDMGGAGAVLTDFSIPAIAIARDPGIEFLRHETNSWKKQDPGQEFPAGKQHRDTSPSVRAAIDSAARVHRLHPTQGRVAVHLRETPLRFGVVGVEELDEAAAVEAAAARGAGPAQGANSAIENGEVRHALFSVAGARIGRTLYFTPANPASAGPTPPGGGRLTISSQARPNAELRFVSNHWNGTRTTRSTAQARVY